MVGSVFVSSTAPDDEERLRGFGLSTELVHDAFRPGLTRASNRTAKALSSTPGTDIYHDAMEKFHRLLAESGWRMVYVDRQPRLVHPAGLLSFTVASAVHVADPDPRRAPHTRRKGKATRDSLAPSPTISDSLFDVDELTQTPEDLAKAEAAPLWFMLHERTDRGLRLEFARPENMTEGGVVTRWKDSIIVAFLDLDGDLSAFDAPDDDSYDVLVEPR